MKISIRTNTFETNSSSVHAIVVDMSGNNSYNPPSSVSLGEYGWEEGLFFTEEERIEYIWTLLNEYYNPDFDFWIEDSDLDALENWKMRLIDVLNLPSNISFEEPLQRGIFIGIDHPEELEHFLSVIAEDDEILRNFVYGKNSYIRTGNDNSNTFDYEAIEALLDSASQQNQKVFIK